MKRSKLLLVALLSLVLSAVSSACLSHFHNYGNWAITTEPTLEAEGVWTQTCECGTSVEKKIPALSDESVWTKTETVDPTHFDEGKDIYTSAYGTVEVTLPVIPHEYGAYVIVTEPTVDNKGSATHSCACGHVETVDVPALIDASVWSVESVASDHKVHGTDTYTSIYGTVVVELPLIAHEYGAFVLSTEPTIDNKGSATHSCACGHVETVDVPALSDSSVWTLTTVASDHKVQGTDTYTSIYGTIVVELPLKDYEYGAWVLVTNPTFDDSGSASRTCECGCGEVETVVVPTLSDSTVWSVAHTVAPDYNSVGEDTYTSIYGEVKVDVAKLVAPYDGKTYSSFNFNAKTDEGWKNGVVNVEDVWSNATISIGANSTGFGTAYPFKGAYKFVIVNALTGEVAVHKYEQLTQEVWVPDEESMDPEEGYFENQPVVDEDGNPVFDWSAPVETYTAWVDFATGLMIAPRYATFDDVNVYTPFEIGYASKGAKASAWDNSIAISYSINESTYSIFVHDGRAYFGVSFVDLKGNAIAVEECYNASNVKVLNAEGALIKAFASNGEKLVESDGYEGTYDNSETSDTIFLNGAGIAVLNETIGSYVIEGDVIGLYIEGEYFEVTLNGSEYTSVKPMVTLTFEAGEYATVESVTVNKNIAITLPAPTNETHMFKGWTLADGSVVSGEYIPVESVTLVAVWKSKIIIKLSGVLAGDADVIYLGEGDVIGELLPAYGVEESLGKVFRGWYLDADFATTLPESAELTEQDSGITVYAKWEDLPAYYGIFGGNELYSQSSTYSFMTLKIDENGVYTNSSSSSKSGIIVGYDEATQIISWKKSATDTTIYYLWFDAESGILVAPYSNGTKMGQDIYLASKYQTEKVSKFWAVKIALSSTDSTRGFYGRIVTVATNDGVENVFVTNERIYSNVSIKNALGEDLSPDTVKNSKTLIVTDLNTGVIVAAVASKGDSFSAKSDTIDLDAYFGSYTCGTETVVLDGTGVITYAGKTGTYEKVEGKEYGFDVYLDNNGEYYQLTLSGDSCTMVKPMATLTLNLGVNGGSEAHEINVNVAFVLPVLTNASYQFNGWYYDAECSANPVGESIVITEDTELYSLWKLTKVLTVVYNNGEADGAIEYSEGDAATLDTPVYAKHAFVGWFTTETFDEGSEWTNGSIMTDSITIYAKWETAPIYNATYASFEIDKKDLNGGTSGSYSRNAVIEIDPYGHAPKGSSWPFANANGTDVKNFNAETGYLELHTGSNIYWGYIDFVTGIMILNDSNGVGVDMDEVIFMNPFESKNSSSSFSSSYWASGMARAIQYTFDGTTYSIFVYNNNVHFNVSFVDASGNAVAGVDCYKAATLLVKAADGTLIGKFGHDGTTMQLMDGFEGTYTVADGEIIVDGVKTITIGGVSGTYSKAAEGSSYTHDAYVGGSYYEVSLDNVAYTAVVNKPMVTVTYETDGKAEIAAVSVNKNIALALPIPSNDAFVFKGWYFDAAFENAVPAEFVPTADVTLYAKWAAKVTLTVVYGNGLETVVLDYAAGDTVAPQQISNNGLYFGGWFLDAELTLPYTVGVIESNTTIYCAWVEKAPYTFEGGEKYTFVYVDGEWTSNNKGIGSSTASVRLTANGNITVSFDYSVSSESGWDKLYIYVNGIAHTDSPYSGTKSGSCSVSLEAGQDIYIYYSKDGSGNRNNDTATISALTVNGVAVTQFTK